MRGDNIALEAKKDLLLNYFGNSYLKKHRREHMTYACSTRMRELSRLLIIYRDIVNDNTVQLKDIIRPHHFDAVLSAVRQVVGYDPFKKTFKSPSLAMHLGTSLKLVCDELTNYILKETVGFKLDTRDESKAILQDFDNDFESISTETEKILTKKYKRVINGGKGSRAVVVLVPEAIQDFIATLLKRRDKYVSKNNDYLFAIPGSRIQRGKGDVALRMLTNRITLESPGAISSIKLRKQIATIMQILNLSRDETKQFSDFMGHTQKTHEESYE
nr:unnamed protein product [Callosobruchus analis]